jgi:hypothetical protein
MRLLAFAAFCWLSLSAPAEGRCLSNTSETVVGPSSADLDAILSALDGTCTKTLLLSPGYHYVLTSQTRVNQDLTLSTLPDGPPAILSGSGTVTDPLFLVESGEAFTLRRLVLEGPTAFISTDTSTQGKPLVGERVVIANCTIRDYAVRSSGVSFINLVSTSSAVIESVLFYNNSVASSTSDGATPAALMIVGLPADFSLSNCTFDSNSVGSTGVSALNSLILLEVEATVTEVPLENSMSFSGNVFRGNTVEGAGSFLIFANTAWGVPVTASNSIQVSHGLTRGRAWVCGAEPGRSSQIRNSSFVRNSIRGPVNSEDCGVALGPCPLLPDYEGHKPCLRSFHLCSPGLYPCPALVAQYTMGGLSVPIVFSGVDFETNTAVTNGGLFSALFSTAGSSITSVRLHGNELQSSSYGLRLYQTVGCALSGLTIAANTISNMAILVQLFEAEQTSVQNVRFLSNVATQSSDVFAHQSGTYLTLQGVTMIGNMLDLSSGIYISQSDYSGMTNVQVSGNTVTNGGVLLALYQAVDSSAVGLTFSNNTMRGSFGLMLDQVQGASVSASFTGNSLLSRSFGLEVTNSPGVTLETLTFSQNVVTDSSNALSLLSSSNTLVLQAVASYNTLSSSILFYMHQGDCFLSSLSLTNNSLSDSVLVGALQVPQLDISGSTFVFNNGSGDANALSLVQSGANITSTSFVSNKMASGSPTMTQDSRVTFASTAWIANECSNGAGGAVTVREASAVVLDECTFRGNTAPLGTGGAVNVGPGSNLSVVLSAFSHDSAGLQGDDIYLTPGLGTTASARLVACSVLSLSVPASDAVAGNATACQVVTQVATPQPTSGPVVPLAPAGQGPPTHGLSPSTVTVIVLSVVVALLIGFMLFRKYRRRCFGQNSDGRGRRKGAPLQVRPPITLRPSSAIPH